MTLQRIIQVISQALHRQPHHFVMTEEKPLTHEVELKEAIGEIAIDAANALDIEEVGYLCPYGDGLTDEPHCEDCFPIFRIRSIEDA